MGRYFLFMGHLRTLGDVLSDVCRSYVVRQLLHVCNLSSRRRHNRCSLSYLFRPADCKQCRESVSYSGSTPDRLQFRFDLSERYDASLCTRTPDTDRIRRGRNPSQALHRPCTRQRQHAGSSPADLYQFNGYLHRHADRCTGQCRQHRRFQYQERYAQRRPYCRREYYFRETRCRQHQGQHH